MGYHRPSRHFIRHAHYSRHSRSSPSALQAISLPFFLLVLLVTTGPSTAFPIQHPQTQLSNPSTLPETSLTATTISPSSANHSSFLPEIPSFLSSLPRLSFNLNLNLALDLCSTLHLNPSSHPPSNDNTQSSLPNHLHTRSLPASDPNFAAHAGSPPPAVPDSNPDSSDGNGDDSSSGTAAGLRSAAWVLTGDLWLGVKWMGVWGCVLVVGWLLGIGRRGGTGSAGVVGGLVR